MKFKKKSEIFDAEQSSIGTATSTINSLSTVNPLGINSLSSCISSSSCGSAASSFNVAPSHDPVIDIKPSFPYGAMYLKKYMTIQGQIKEG